MIISLKILVKWARQLRSEELKEVKRFANGIILSKGSSERKMEALKIFPIIKFLIHIENGELIV